MRKRKGIAGARSGPDHSKRPVTTSRGGVSLLLFASAWVPGGGSVYAAVSSSGIGCSLPSSSSPWQVRPTLAQALRLRSSPGERRAGCQLEHGHLDRSHLRHPRALARPRVRVHEPHPRRLLGRRADRTDTRRLRRHPRRLPRLPDAPGCRTAARPVAWRAASTAPVRRRSRRAPNAGILGRFGRHPVRRARPRRARGRPPAPLRGAPQPSADRRPLRRRRPDRRRQRRRGRRHAAAPHGLRRRPPRGRRHLPRRNSGRRPALAARPRPGRGRRRHRQHRIARPPRPGRPHRAHRHRHGRLVPARHHRLPTRPVRRRPRRTSPGRGRR
jgi:hypothetical protein